MLICVILAGFQFPIWVRKIGASVPAAYRRTVDVSIPYMGKEAKRDYKSLEDAKKDSFNSLYG